MLGWIDDIEALTLENTSFGTVVHTGAHAHLTPLPAPDGSEVGQRRARPR